jgi:hypothetical protein
MYNFFPVNSAMAVVGIVDCVMAVVGIVDCVLFRDCIKYSCLSDPHTLFAM